MTYSNTWKLSNGATVQIGSTTWEDAISIGLPGNMVELVDITNLGSTRKEYTPSDMPDADEITVTVPYLGAPPAVAAAGSSAVSCVIVLPKINKTLAFSAFVTKVAPAQAEIDGKLSQEITLKPTTIVTVS